MPKHDLCPVFTYECHFLNILRCKNAKACAMDAIISTKLWINRRHICTFFIVHMFIKFNSFQFHSRQLRAIKLWKRFMANCYRSKIIRSSKQYQHKLIHNLMIWLYILFRHVQCQQTFSITFPLKSLFFWRLTAITPFISTLEAQLWRTQNAYVPIIFFDRAILACNLFFFNEKLLDWNSVVNHLKRQRINHYLTDFPFKSWLLWWL